MKKLAVILLPLLSVGCNPTSEQIKPAPLVVSTYNVDQAVSVKQSQFQGAATPYDLTKLSFRQSGKISQLLVKAGQQVEKGDVIATLDDVKQKQQVNDAEAKFELAQNQLLRSEQLKQKGMISAAEYEELTANYTLAKISLELANRELAFTELKSPFSGLVAEVPVKQYQVIQPGDVIASLYDGSRILVATTVPDSFVTWLQDQPKGELTADVEFSSNSGEYRATLKSYSGEPLETANSYVAQFELPQLDPPVLPGTSATIKVDANGDLAKSKIAVRIPTKLLVAGDAAEQFVVWKLEQGQTVKQPVQVGQINRNGAVINSGVELGDKLIATNLLKLEQGSELHIVEGIHQ
ncbi:efflux RND transporter periplasmic adaptor subunit [Vibrio ulleungensis]|uniref:Efflux RND transporter periplasmic adaptor subunit n=1 Tax=Vibrio ulleungensis TaxID=2807619 RepID=A0ABS2HJE8_9VIBR|nr:efflux RND transporter periplasmic adaptor subunit [Vibrio ulleungensis]MBM7035941.1 efflux RND transporter periplasmic adaptor subunit [Vibrio ulleungensis]